MALSSGDNLQLQLHASYDKLMKLVVTLEEILNHVESKKDEMEILCQETRKLLKPLPKWLDRSKHESQMNEITLEKKEEKKCDPRVRETPSENELSELSLINKALEKAQKTWQKHQHSMSEDVSNCKEVSYDSVKDQSKSKRGSDCEEFTSANDVVTSDAKIGIISEKELTRALSNVRVSQMKSAYKKAPDKTFAHEQKKTSLSSQTNKMQTKPSFQQSRHTNDSTVRNLTRPKDGKSHSSLKSLGTNSNLSKESETHLKMTYLDKDKSSRSSQMKNTQNEFEIAESEEHQKEIGLKLNSNIDCDTLYVIPSSIKHLCQENHRLRKTVGKTKVPPKNGESFLRLWETKMEKMPNIKATMFTQKYENLYKLLQSLDLPSLSDSSSPEEILATKISMEYILTSMYDLNQQTETLLRKAKKNSTSAVIPQTKQTPTIVPKEIWLPPHLLNSRCHHDLKESSARLHYSSLEEVNDFWNEQHKLQESLLSQHLLKIIFECLLPLLKSKNLQQRERLIIYRTLVGFLHHNGKNFPTLIDS